jgi:phosphoribosylformylglycinamidine synthase
LAQQIERPDTHKDVLAYVLDVLRNRAWVYRQYDSQLFLNTVFGPGQADAALMRLAAPGVATTSRGFAITTDGNHRWCAVDPRIGTAMLVLEATMNLACVGAKAKALVDNLNFGNPEHPEVMWQLSESIDGMAEACVALDLPVVGGNVSLYNESGGKNIHPTPVVGVVGLVDELVRRPASIAADDDGVIVHIGPMPAPDSSLAGSRWAWRAGQQHGSLPAVDYDMHERVLDTIVELVNEPNLLLAVHDVADGGLAVALAEVAVRSGRGVQLDDTFAGDPSALVGELPSRAIVVVPAGREGNIIIRAAANGVAAQVVGRLQGSTFSLTSDGGDAVDLGELRNVHTLENESTTQGG